MSANQLTMWTELMGMEFRQTYYDAGGVRTRVLEAGSGEPLVLMHGGGGHAETYIHNIPELAKHFHVYAIDILAHGFTEQPPMRNYTYDDFVKHIGDFQTAIGADQIYLSGVSISAISAALYAGQNPKRVKRLVLNTGVPLQTDAAGIARYVGAIQKEVTNANKGWTREGVKERLGGIFFGGAETVPEELIDVRYRMYGRPGVSEYLGKVVPTLLTELTIEGAMAKAGEVALRNIECPTLLLWTERNPSQGLGVAERALKMLRDGRMVVFDKSGHWPHWEEADRYNKLMVEFLSGKEPSSLT